MLFLKHVFIVTIKNKNVHSFLNPNFLGMAEFKIAVTLLSVQSNHFSHVLTFNPVSTYLWLKSHDSEISWGIWQVLRGSDVKSFLKEILLI